MLRIPNIIFLVILLASSWSNARAASFLDICSRPSVEAAVGKKVISEFASSPTFASTFDMTKSHFKILDVSIVSETSTTTLCEGRFITSFFLKPNVADDPKTLTALSSVARYEVTLAEGPDDPQISIYHDPNSEVLVCYHDNSCGPMEKRSD